jgi:molybdate transport system regulatory protein
MSVAVAVGFIALAGVAAATGGSCGSIAAAGRAMNMSYKRAWDLVDEINRICKRAVVKRWEGGKGGGGAMLTQFGTSLVSRYRKVERLVLNEVRKDLVALRADTDVG